MGGSAVRVRKLRQALRVRFEIDCLATSADRVPGDVGQPVRLAVLDHLRLARLIDCRKLVLHRDDLRFLPRNLDLLDGEVRDADMLDLSGALQIGESAHRILDRNFGVGSMKLVEIYPFQFERLQASVARCAQMLRAAVAVPAAFRACASTFCRDDDPAFVPSLQGCSDQALVVPCLGVVGAVGVGCVDEVDAELVDGAAEQGNGFLFGGATVAVDREVHGTVADRGYFDSGFADLTFHGLCIGFR